MLSNNKPLQLEDWIEVFQSQGKFSFSLNELRLIFDEKSATALRGMLNRLIKKEKIVSIFQGYYLIIPAQYLSKGILPPSMFIDGLMSFLEKKYYVALLNAAALFGAAHQQPQEYFVVTEYPTLRASKKKGLKINYISTQHLPPESLLIKKKTETGYITVSNPILTALDLIDYEKKIGGINRAVAIIADLVENIKKKDVNKDFIQYASVKSLQRLGFVLEDVLNEKELANTIFNHCKKAKIKFYLTSLKPSDKKNKGLLNKKWNLLINTEIILD